MCTEEDHKRKSKSMVHFYGQIDISAGFLLLLGCRLFSQLLELNA